MTTHIAAKLTHTQEQSPKSCNSTHRAPSSDKERDHRAES